MTGHQLPAAVPIPGAAAGPARVIGLDLSLTATGLAYDHGDTLGITTIRTGKLHGPPRLTTIRDQVLADALGKNLAVIEGPSYGHQGGAGHHESAGLWWLIAWTLTEHGVPYAVVPPSTLKKYATGNGSATKADMRMALYQRTGLDLRDDNQVDAWWLRAAGLEYLGQPLTPLTTLPASQRLALNKASWPEVTS